MIERAHLDNVLTLPADLEDYEARAPLQIPKAETYERGDERSPGEMLEAAAQQEKGGSVHQDRKGRRPTLHTGTICQEERAIHD